MKADVYNLQGEKSSTVELPDEIFAAKVNGGFDEPGHTCANWPMPVWHAQRKRRGESPAAASLASKGAAVPVRAARFPPSGLEAAAFTPRSRVITAS